MRGVANNDMPTLPSDALSIAVDRRLLVIESSFRFAHQTSKRYLREQEKLWRQMLRHGTI